MMPEILSVNHENQSLLIDYFKQFGTEHDSSYMPGRDFQLSAKHPSYLLMKGDRVAGAVSLMRTDQFLRVGKARFSIFHARSGDQKDYFSLMEAIRPHLYGLKSVYLFIPEENEAVAEILKCLEFEVERYSFVLERGGSLLPDPVFPEGMHISPLTSDDKEGLITFADCINEEFKDLAGHTPSSAEFIQTFFEDQGYIKDGICLLKEGQEPIGTIVLMHDVDNMAAGEIMGLGILEGYRGKALGRNLLRYGYNFLINQGLDPVILSVNGENQEAISLYKGEGFKLTESVVCYSHNPNKKM